MKNRLLDGLSFIAITIVVWGVNALQRGLWQDDVQALSEAFQRLHHNFQSLFTPDPSPLRRLTLVPSAIALATPHPIWALHFLCAAIWLAHALFAGWIVALLMPGRRWTRFIVVCLTLTATSDFTTGSIVALAYNFAALLLLAAVICALLWIQRGSVAALVASPVMLACSLLTMDVALPAIPFLALLFLIVDRRRSAALLATWAVVLVPIAIVEWSFLHDPKSYAAIALQPMPAIAFLKRTIALWLENFAPWRWAFARPEWFARPARVIPIYWMAIGALTVSSLVLIRSRKKVDDGPHAVRLAILFAAMALAANAAYAAVWFSDIHYRTHILSRVWASLAIGIVAGWRRTPLSYAIVTLFIFFGTWGAIERQDFYLASWREHHRELASILAAAPSLRPGTAVILRGTANGHYMATQADYLTKHWLRLLYDDPKLKACKDCSAGRSPLVVMDFDARTGTYHLVQSLGDGIIRRPLTTRQRRLLLE